ncbi:unnamed protein product [Strongylus vulgaris]|uniref:Uncharacterized protein n=1 Tax=Strongylus vulgaris TaxID=40348 RepID=A0A3P7HYE2_STRVU|nr:unnamed protein product [Strongylus vulgaris]
MTYGCKTCSVPETSVETLIIEEDLTNQNLYLTSFDLENIKNGEKNGDAGGGVRIRPADYEPFERTQVDILLFVIIAVGATILVCLIVPAAIYVVKNRKTDMKAKMPKKKGRKSEGGKTPTSASAGKK